MAENEDQVNEPEEIPSQETPAADAPETPAPEAPAEPTAEEVVAEGDEVVADEDLEFVEQDETPRMKPAIPGMDLEVDIVREGEGLLGGERPRYSEDEDYVEEEETDEDGEEELPQTIADASIDLAAGARYRATGKRKTAVARVTLKPGTGAYIINGKTLDEFFPRATLQRTIRQPLETVGYEDRMDVVASMHGGGVSAQAGALIK
jgi:small subunit ribosomal protein S9